MVMPYKTGKSKSLDDITLTDVLENPIWEWALGEEGIDGQDETWQRPIIDTDNVTKEIYNPTITLKIKETDIYGSAEYDNESGSISAISIWSDNEWKVLDDCKFSTPIIFIAVPKIDGIENAEFICKDLSGDIATKL
jgi:hypothetical protein